MDLDERDLHKTRSKPKRDADDTKNEMEMTDAALEELEELKPMCIDIVWYVTSGACEDTLKRHDCCNLFALFALCSNR